MMMGYAKNPFVELMDWMYVRYEKIKPGYLMQNKEEIQATYNVEYRFDILFYQIRMEQEFSVVGN